MSPLVPLRLPPPITSRTNARVKSLRASLSGEASKTGDPLGVEGLHLIGELHKTGHSFETVYVREGSEYVLEQGWPAKLDALQWAVLSREVFDSAVTTTSPQGIAATWAIREPNAPSNPPGNVLLLENLQDPGNVGTLIRSAEAFGVQQVMMTPSTASQWNPKVVRSSAGSVFRMPVVRAPLQNLLSDLRSAGVRIFAAVGAFIGEPAIASQNGVLFGKQANAPHGKRYADADHSMSPGRFHASFSFDTDFTQPCAILIGNEGAGLSDEARALADEQVQIPCNTESLNAAIAGSVLMYEVQRQIRLRVWAQQQELRP